MATKLGIPLNRYCTHSHYSDEMYGAWEESYEVTVGEFAIVEPKNQHYTGHQVEHYEGDVKDGDTLWVIIAIYSSGNSFGFSTSGSDDIISIHKDADVALRNLKALEGKGKGDRYEDDMVVVELDDGTTHKYYRPWLGYFESLDSLQIYEMIATVEKDDDDD